MIKDASIYWNKFADFLLNNISTFIILWWRFQLEIELFLSNFLSCSVQNIIMFMLFIMLLIFWTKVPNDFINSPYIHASFTPVATVLTSSSSWTSRSSRSSSSYASASPRAAFLALPPAQAPPPEPPMLRQALAQQRPPPRQLQPRTTRPQGPPPPPPPPPPPRPLVAGNDMTEIGCIRLKLLLV